MTLWDHICWVHCDIVGAASFTTLQLKLALERQSVVVPALKILIFSDAPFVSIRGALWPHQMTRQAFTEAQPASLASVANMLNQLTKGSSLHLLPRPTRSLVSVTLLRFGTKCWWSYGTKLASQRNVCLQSSSAIGVFIKDCYTARNRYDRGQNRGPGWSLAEATAVQTQPEYKRCY